MMENGHKTLHLYIPVYESRHWSPSLSHCGGPPSPFKVSLELQQGPTSHCKEEEKGSNKTEKQDQTDTFGLRDRRESLKPLGDLSKIGRLTDLLPLCLERQAFIRMGNQQGAKIKPHYHGHAENLDALPKSPRFQIPRKRRRRAERPVYSTDSLQRFKMTPRILPLRTRGVTRLQITSSPTFGEWDSEEDGQIFCTPACRRKRVLKSPHALQPSLRMKSPGGLTAEKKDPSFPRNGSPSKKESSLPDSDTDQSEYDELYPVFTSSYSEETAKKIEDDARETPKFPIIQPESDKVQEKGAKVAEKKSPWMCDEMGRRDAARRVMGKIEELESIIRQVSLNSSDWSREEEAKCSGQVDEGKQRCGAELSSQNKLTSEDKPQLLEEFQTLSEALSRSLRQVLKVEGAREEKKVLADDEKISEYNPLSYSDHFTSGVPNNTSSHSHSAHVETSSVPSPSLSDVSERTSSRFEVMSSILSPLFTPSQHSLSLSPTHQQREVISDHRNGTIGLVGDNLFAHWTGGCQAVTADPSGRENDNRKTFCQGNLTQSEQDQTQIPQSFSERDDLLSSGNNINHASHQEVECKSKVAFMIGAKGLVLVNSWSDVLVSDSDWRLFCLGLMALPSEMKHLCNGTNCEVMN